MLTHQPIKPVPNDLDRRWLSDDYFDLIVWYEPDGEIHGFQLCYEKGSAERALTCRRDGGATHATVDTGESGPLSNETPVLVPGGVCPCAEVRAQFLARSQQLPSEIVNLVLAGIAAYEHGARS